MKADWMGDQGRLAPSLYTAILTPVMSNTTLSSRPFNSSFITCDITLDDIFLEFLFTKATTVFSFIIIATCMIIYLLDARQLLPFLYYFFLFF